MQLLLGLFFFSILLTTGSSLKCVHCLAINGYCSNIKEECPSENSVCMDMTLKSKRDNKYNIIFKSCSPKEECRRYEDEIEKEVPNVPGIPFESVITKTVCSRAPPSFAPFFPAFLGPLLMKLLF